MGKTLLESLNTDIKNKRTILKDMIILQKSVSLLPQELTKHEWGDNISATVWNWWNEVDFDISLVGVTDKEQQIDEIKNYLGANLGFSFEKIQHQHADSFQYTGVLENTMVLDKRVRINLKSCPKPPNCTLTKVVTTEEVERYEATCDDTGEPI